MLIFVVHQCLVRHVRERRGRRKHCPGLSQSLPQPLSTAGRVTCHVGLRGNPTITRSSRVRTVSLRNFFTVGVLSSSTDSTVNYVVTTLHNFLIVLQDQSAAEIERYNGTQRFINLLEHSNDKLSTLVADCLLKMSMCNGKSKIFIQSHEQCIQRLLFIFETNKYDKLLLTISKLLPIISSGNELIKRIILQCNGLAIFEKHLRTTKSIRIRHNCLITLRNISNQATRMVRRDRELNDDQASFQRDIDSLIQQLAAMLLTDDHQSVLCSLGILNNLTADNRINKSLLVKLNGVQTLMQKLMMNTDGNDDLIEVTVSERNAFESAYPAFSLRSYAHFDTSLLGMISRTRREKRFESPTASERSSNFFATRTSKTTGALSKLLSV